MILRRLLIVALAGATVLPVACLKSGKNPSALIAALSKEKLPAPQPPLPTSGTSDKSSPSVLPPSFDPKANPVPALPGMPGTASQPIPPASIPDSDTLTASADDKERKGLFERIRDKREEKKALQRPPAVEPKRPDGLPVPVPARDPKPETPKEGQRCFVQHRALAAIGWVREDRRSVRT